MDIDMQIDVETNMDFYMNVEYGTWKNIMSECRCWRKV
jgi:hypothetical protein